MTLSKKKSLSESEWNRLCRLPDDDQLAFAALVLDYVGPEEDPFLDGDSELRRRATAILKKHGVR